MATSADDSFSCDDGSPQAVEDDRGEAAEEVNAMEIYMDVKVCAVLALLHL